MKSGGFANPVRRVEPTQADLAEISPAQWRAELTGLFAPDNSPALDLIQATDEIFAGWPTYDFPTMPRWHRDRMLIIGDAAHAASPASGQGASMAIEDGVVLAQCLRDRPDVPAALATYERLRRNRVERVVAQGRRNGDGKAPGPVGRIIRDLALRLILSRVRPGKDPMRWIHEHRIDWDATVADSPPARTAGYRPGEQ